MTDAAIAIVRARLDASVPPMRDQWPVLALRARANGRSAWNEAYAVYDAATNDDGSWRAYRVCLELCERRRIPRELWIAQRRWNNRWTAWFKEYEEWRESSDNRWLDRHSGGKRDRAKAKQQRQARKRQRA
jgi:hypothetical protein